MRQAGFIPDDEGWNKINAFPDTIYWKRGDFLMILKKNESVKVEEFTDNLIRQVIHCTCRSAKVRFEEVKITNETKNRQKV